jgi:hypothetical protein
MTPCIFQQTLHTHISEHHHGIRRKQRQDEDRKRVSQLQFFTLLGELNYFHSFRIRNLFIGTDIGIQKWF